MAGLLLATAYMGQSEGSHIDRRLSGLPLFWIFSSLGLSVTSPRPRNPSSRERKANLAVLQPSIPASQRCSPPTQSSSCHDVDTLTLDASRISTQNSYSTKRSAIASEACAEPLVLEPCPCQCAVGLSFIRVAQQLQHRLERLCSYRALAVTSTRYSP